MKERLTGAIILVALIVLVVPELLSGPVRTPAPGAPAAANAVEEAPVRTVKIDIPDEHGRAAAPDPVPEGGASRPMAAAETGAPTPGQAPAATVAGTAEVTPAERKTGPAPVDEAARANSPERAHPAVPREAVGHSEAHGSQKGLWVVQLGSFASRENAERLAAKLRTQGFKSSVSASTGKGRTLWRVRAGTPGERAAAEQLAGRVRAAGHSVSVVAK